MTGRCRWTVVCPVDVEMVISAPTGERIDYRLLAGGETNVVELDVIRDGYIEFRSLDGPAVIAATVARVTR